MKYKSIYCCGCRHEVLARLTNGKEVYPHRKELHRRKYYLCDQCHCYVGCHQKCKKNGVRDKPLGCIPTPKMRKLRQEIHNILDPLWRSGQYLRSDIYNAMSIKMGYDFHVANISSLNEAYKILVIAKQVAERMKTNA